MVAARARSGSDHLRIRCRTGPAGHWIVGPSGPMGPVASASRGGRWPHGGHAWPRSQAPPAHRRLQVVAHRPRRLSPGIPQGPPAVARAGGPRVGIACSRPRPVPGAHGRAAGGRPARTGCPVGRSGPAVRGCLGGGPGGRPHLLGQDGAARRARRGACGTGCASPRPGRAREGSCPGAFPGGLYLRGWGPWGATIPSRGQWVGRSALPGGARETGREGMRVPPRKSGRAGRAPRRRGVAIGAHRRAMVRGGAGWTRMRPGIGARGSRSTSS